MQGSANCNTCTNGSDWSCHGATVASSCATVNAIHVTASCSALITCSEVNCLLCYYVACEKNSNEQHNASQILKQTCETLLQKADSDYCSALCILAALTGVTHVYCDMYIMLEFKPLR
jgi:hypothetical protein